MGQSLRETELFYKDVMLPSLSLLLQHASFEGPWNVLYSMIQGE